MLKDKDDAKVRNGSTVPQVRIALPETDDEMKIDVKDMYVGINSVDFNFLTFCLSRDIGSYEIEEKKHDV